MTDDEEHIRRLMREAIDTAFQQHIGKLFANWLVDPVNQPERAARGVERAIGIYQQAVDGIDGGGFKEYAGDDE